MKKCQFCKSEVKLCTREGNNRDFYYVGCLKCYMRGPECLTSEQAIEIWDNQDDYDMLMGKLTEMTIRYNSLEESFHSLTDASVKLNIELIEFRKKFKPKKKQSPFIINTEEFNTEIDDMLDQAEKMDDDIEKEFKSVLGNMEFSKAFYESEIFTKRERSVK